MGTLGVECSHAIIYYNPEYYSISNNNSCNVATVASVPEGVIGLYTYIHTNSASCLIVNCSYCYKYNNLIAVPLLQV